MRPSPSIRRGIVVAPMATGAAAAAVDNPILDGGSSSCRFEETGPLKRDLFVGVWG